MMEFQNLAGLAAHFERIAQSSGAEKGLEKAAQLLEDKAKEAIGQYHDSVGPVPAWAELADATKADRVAKGFPEDEPLLRTGDLRDSISHEARGNEAWIGSDSDIAEYHETGTSRMPPRPIFGTALYGNIGEVVDAIGHAATVHISGGKG
ncbi:MAG: phage virion morphogenesis protein [Sphingomonadales bacterium]|nr:phage virion morphogenesis protein [Sphingomonadales bacterium]MDE2168780.1 phage virion morphogenesis protein [Sphingomonadales bacterium]